MGVCAERERRPPVIEYWCGTVFELWSTSGGKSARLGAPIFKEERGGKKSLPHSLDLRCSQGAAAGGNYVALTIAFASIPTAPDEQGQEEAIGTEGGESTQNHLIHKEEEKKAGAVDFQVYKAYWLAVGSCLALSILFSLLLMQGEGSSKTAHLSLDFPLLSFPVCVESGEEKRPGVLISVPAAGRPLFSSPA